MRRQKTDKFEALRAGVRTQDRALGFRGQYLEKTGNRETERSVFRPHSAQSAQTHLSSQASVFCPLKCPLKCPLESGNAIRAAITTIRHRSGGNINERTEP
ncbi:MAG: hypothetical protein LBD06_02910 [Candidatus Accumulibacter sp.]|nr:hypothetical protein [Accumulibacter sp.]